MFFLLDSNRGNISLTHRTYLMYGLGFKPGRGRPPSQMIHNEKISIINQKKSATSTSYGTRSYFFYEGKSQMAKDIHLQMWKTVAIWCEKLFAIWIFFGKNTANCCIFVLWQCLSLSFCPRFHIKWQKFFTFWLLPW